MQRTEQITELAVALAAAQGQIGPARMSGENPHLHNRYATLDDILEAIREPLTNNGLSFLQLLDGGELTTILMHESGQWLSASTPIESLSANRGTNDMQAYGATLTYLKRYALAAMLGVASDEDVDAQVKHAPAPRRKQRPWVEDGKSYDAFLGWCSKQDIEGGLDAVLEALGIEELGNYRGSKADAKKAVLGLVRESHWIDDVTTRKRFWTWTNELGLSHEEVHEALGVESVKDFGGTKDAARAKINEWIEQQT